MTRMAIIVAGLMAMLLLGVWWGYSLSRGNRDGVRSASRSELSGSTSDEFVGSAACLQCHREVAAAYETSGHAHTFHLTAELDLARQLAGVEFADPRRRRNLRYHFDREGLAVSLPAVFGEEQFPLTYALGSGTHAVSFLTLLPHREGGTVGLEHRATHYNQLHGLGLTVGHPDRSEPVEEVEHFGRVLDGKKLTDCLGCHTTRFAIEDHQLTGLIPQVGCEKCHGPGRDHIAAKRAGLVGPDIGSAHRWPTALDELRACGECHRLPESLKPSELVRSSRILPRFQPAGLMQSRCFLESEGALRCTTCHDPHAKVSSDAAYYESICLNCHRSQSAPDCPQSRSDCINCHMPKVAFEGVAAFHDHWIRVRNDEDPAPVPSEPSPALP